MSASICCRAVEGGLLDCLHMRMRGQLSASIYCRAVEGGLLDCLHMRMGVYVMFVPATLQSNVVT
jgi:hypothetical protein